MKRSFPVFAFATICLISCNVKTSSTDTMPADSAAKATASPAPTEEQLHFPYQLDHPYAEWQPGDPKHALTVMNSLKAYENGDIDACVEAFGDTVDLKFDRYYAKVSHDSLKKIFTQARSAISAKQIKMSDWESVISKDRKLEYVTLWYKEIDTDKKGKIDSVSVVDDLKIVNGKIVEIDEKIQHFPAAVAKK